MFLRSEAGVLEKGCHDRSIKGLCRRSDRPGSTLALRFHAYQRTVGADPNSYQATGLVALVSPYPPSPVS